MWNNYWLWRMRAQRYSPGLNVHVLKLSTAFIFIYCVTQLLTIESAYPTLYSRAECVHLLKLWTAFALIIKVNVHISYMQRLSIIWENFTQIISHSALDYTVWVSILKKKKSKGFRSYKNIWLMRICTQRYTPGKWIVRFPKLSLAFTFTI
jgi:hypothetical protein